MFNVLKFCKKIQISNNKEKQVRYTYTVTFQWQYIRKRNSLSEGNLEKNSSLKQERFLSDFAENYF